MEYEPVIGLEVHVQLNTKSKIFCKCSTRFGSKPNSQTCPVCLALPGVLPVFNEEVLKKAILAGLALHSDISKYSKFDRKNYFYPDLPKAYQITQYDMPICKGGNIEIVTDIGKKKIGINRLHLEEDAGKSIHSADLRKNISYVDLNRTGVPLAEIVSEPDMRSGNEAYEYLLKLKSLMKYIKVSDVNMEEGSLRCDVNISIRKKGDDTLGKKVEIKNLNSFKAVKSSINFEYLRQVRVLESGESINQESRLWDSDKNETFSMRLKEDAHDYRYFPEPDLAPVIIDDEYIAEIKKQLPELPDEKYKRFISEYKLPEYDTGILTSEMELANYYEGVLAHGANPKMTSNWIMSELLAKIDAPESINSFIVTPLMLSKLLKLIDSNIISGKIAKKVFEEMIKTGKDSEKIVEEQGLVQVSDISLLESMIDTVIDKNQKSVEDFQNGKKKALGYLVGQVMKESKGKAEPRLVNELLKKKLIK